MTKNASFKKIIRARMEQTGESYTQVLNAIKKENYERGYRDGLAGKEAEHTPGYPEPIYRPVAYPEYVDGHKKGKEERIKKGL